jgi:hypothetical protein
LLITTTTISHDYLGKKLKKRLERLENLERQANSVSASPAPAEIPTSCAKQGISKSNTTSVQPSLAPSEYSLRTFEPPQIGFSPLLNEYLFSESSTGQTSHSPPPPVDYLSASYPDPDIYESSFTSPYPTQPQHISPSSNEIADDTPAFSILPCEKDKGAQEYTEEIQTTDGLSHVSKQTGGCLSVAV